MGRLRPRPLYALGIPSVTAGLLGWLALSAGCSDGQPAMRPRDAGTPPSGVAWAAHPQQLDGADAVAPSQSLAPGLAALLGDRQATARAVAFFVHATTDLSMDVRSTPVDEATERVDEAVRYQASVLNGVARVWAPRYRQASLGTLRSAPSREASDVLDQAYADVRLGFEAFLKESQGLPIFLLGHGQGAAHLVRLLREYFEGTPLTHRLVVAYLAGELVGTDTFATLKPCDGLSDVGCFASWVSVKNRATPRVPCGSEQLSRCMQVNTHRLPVACFNPVSGGRLPSPPAVHRGAGPGGGAFGGHFFDFVSGLVGAACDDQGLLRIDARTEVEGLSAHDFAGIEEGDYHPLDINLFYLDLRADAATRLHAWTAKSSRPPANSP